MHQDTVSTVSLLVVGIALVAGVGVAFTLLGTAEQTAVHDADAPGFVVDVHADGDARMHVTYTYNLSEEERKQAFSDLQDSESSQEHFRDDFESRLSTVAANASERVDRNMSVSDATIHLETVDDTGVVTVSITWHNLAGHEGDDLVVTEPFTSGFFPDRPFYVVLPDNYTVSSVTPTPATSTEESLQWDAGTDMTGFELVTSPPTDDGTSDDTDAEDSTEETDDTAEEDGSTDSSDTDEDGETTDDSDGSQDGGDSSGDDTSGDNTDADDGTDGGADDDGSGFGILLGLLALFAVVSLATGVKARQ